MGSRIFALRGDGELAPMDEAPYELEDVLQGLLAEYPDLLAVNQSGTQSQAWLLVTREAGVPDHEAGGDRWAVDHLFLDRAGIPTLVEVKRSSDTRLRREVLGQMLDYAANAVVYWPPEAIRERFETRCEHEGHPATNMVAEFLDGALEVEEFWERVRTNLQAERIRLILVADEIPSETRRVLEFLNGQLDPAEVLGVEIRQYVGEGIKTLVPQVVGQTAEAEQKKGRPRASRSWDPDSFDADLTSRRGEDAVQVARRIRTWAEGHGLDIDWGTGAVQGSFMPRARRGNTRHPTFGVSSAGEVQIHLGVMHDPPFDSLSMRRELLDRLGEIGGVEFRNADLEKGWPIMRLEGLTRSDALEHFLATWDWFLDQLEQ